MKNLYAVQVCCTAIELEELAKGKYNNKFNLIDYVFQYTYCDMKLGIKKNYFDITLMSDIEDQEELMNKFRRAINHVRSGETLPTHEILTRMKNDDEILTSQFHRKRNQLKALFESVFFISENGIEGILTTNPDATIANIIEEAKDDARAVYQELTDEEVEDYERLLYTQIQTLDEIRIRE